MSDNVRALIESLVMISVISAVIIAYALTAGKREDREESTKR